MYSQRVAYRNVHRDADGLGIAPWLVDLIVGVGGSVSSAVATRLISRPSSPSQKEIEDQIRLQHQLEIERMLMQQQQTEQVAKYALPLVGLVALVMLLR